MNLPRKLTRWREKRLHPSTIIVVVSYALVGILVIGGIAALVSALISERSRAESAQAEISSLRATVQAKDDDLAALIAQYAELYDDCDETEGCVSTVPAPEVIEQVLPISGPQGETGPGPTSEEIDDAVARYCILNADCRGAVGAAGANGTNGTDGAAGATGQAGADGVGIQGPQGETGATGPAGADGQPPASWTYTDALGFEHTCSRVDDFDPATPRYSCQ